MAPKKIAFLEIKEQNLSNFLNFKIERLNCSVTKSFCSLFSQTNN
jgi:hypothetical protein